MEYMREKKRGGGDLKKKKKKHHFNFSHLHRDSKLYSVEYFILHKQ